MSRYLFLLSYTLMPGAVMLPQINASNVLWEVTVANTQF
jgi:hypothetical protein